MSRLEPVTLTGRDVVLEPLSHDHIPAMIVAAEGDRSTFGLTMVPSPDDASVRDYIDLALAQQAAGTSVPFATIRRCDGVLVGSTRFLNIETWVWPLGRPIEPAEAARTTPHAAEIGSTWLSQKAQRTAINSGAKLLMLTHAFEVWSVRRLFFKTDERNVQSRRNIERSGATFEGILRNHMHAYDAGTRHSAYYSIIDTEWPNVKQTLMGRIESYQR